MSPRPRLLILGTGAMACALGARLARSGRASVTLSGTWGDALEAIAQHGIRVEESGETWTASVEARPLAGPHDPADFVLVLVKSPRTQAVAPIAARLLAASGLLLTLQNGLGNRETLEAAAGPERVGIGVLTMGATLLGPGRVRVFPGRVVLAAKPVTRERIAALAQLLRDTGVETEESPAIDQVLWRKLVVNCAINALSALGGCPNGGLLALPEPRGTLRRAAREVGAVAVAKGIALEADPGALALEVAEATAGNRSSMLRDIERGALTEIDALNGAVVCEARALGVPTPVNEDLWRRVREREGRPLVPRPAVEASA